MTAHSGARPSCGRAGWPWRGHTSFTGPRSQSAGSCLEVPEGPGRATGLGKHGGRPAHGQKEQRGPTSRAPRGPACGCSRPCPASRHPRPTRWGSSPVPKLHFLRLCPQTPIHGEELGKVGTGNRRAEGGLPQGPSGPQLTLPTSLCFGIAQSEGGTR